MNKLLSYEEFEEKNYQLCKFEHVFEDQEGCLECDGMPSNNYLSKGCGKINDAFEEYKRSHTDDDSIFIMMTAQ